MQVSILRSEYLRGEIEIEMVPFGTLLERIRSGGCGIPAFYLPIGIGTTTEEGKEKRVFNDKQYLLETAIKADFAFVHARKGDRLGNLTYRLAARAANPIVATAAKTVIAEVDEIVEPGEIDPDIVHTPGIYITRVIKSTKYEILFK
jgi:3-oxoacid CoA-transferase subunit A